MPPTPRHSTSEQQNYEEYAYDDQYYTDQQYQEYYPEDSYATSTDYTTQLTQGDQGALSTAGAEYEVGPDQDTTHWFPPEYYVKYERGDRPPVTKTAKGEFERIMKKRPWKGDDEEVDETMVAAPKAVALMVKVKGGKKARGRPCWLRLSRAWVRRHFLTHLLGPCNIRYRGMTYCSICHHSSSAWDCHPLCWQCYVELDLPLCGLHPEIDCEFCDKMGFHARNARNEMLAKATAEGGEQYLREHVKSGLPSNVYNQADADAWTAKKKSKETPNPDWFLPKEPVGSCFPAALVQAGQSVADAIAANPEWASEGYAKQVKAHNNALKDRRHVKTPSQQKTVYVHKSLIWGTRRTTQLNEKVKNVQQEASQETSQLKPSEPNMLDMLTENRRALEALTEKLTPLFQMKKLPELSIQTVLENLTGDDLQQAMKDLPGTAEASGGEYSEEDIRNMTQEQLSTLLITMQGKLRQQKPVQQRSTKSSRESSVERNKGRDSPWLRRQNEDPTIAQLYQEKKMRLMEWRGKYFPHAQVDTCPGRTSGRQVHEDAEQAQRNGGRHSLAKANLSRPGG